MDGKGGRFTMTRREFGMLAGAAAAAAMLPRPTRLALAAENAAPVIPGKSAQMIVHDARLGILETPLELLRQHEHTPKEILFTRFQFPLEGDAAWMASLDAPQREGWTLEVAGLVQRPRTVKLADIEKMDRVKRVSVLQCAANGRAFFAAEQQVPGVQWKNGGMGNVEWEGVPLRQFLEEMDVAPDASVEWLTAEGWDQPASRKGSDFAKSYLLADGALDFALLALRMNGEPIAAAHGGPLRLVIPGYYADNNVKLLTKLQLMDRPSPSIYQALAYRFPKRPVKPGRFGSNDYTVQNSRPTYGQQIRSVIFSPLPEDKPGAGESEITGVAFNDGLAPVTAVQVSADGGQSWVGTTLKPAESPWAWYHWSAKATLKPGENVLMSIATDALGRSQPLDGTTRWNPRGYEWNGAERVVINV